MIRVKLTLQMLQTLLHTNPSHQDEPFQSPKIKSILSWISGTKGVYFKNVALNFEYQGDNK